MSLGLLRLGHPFPSLLNATATFAIATLAGGSTATAARLAVSMLGIQVAIGALNDRVDAARDAVVKPRKPIPAGLATDRQAVELALGAALVGIALSAWSGGATAVVAATGLGLGVAYDLWLSRTGWSWVPLALAVPLVPVHAWLGATGGLPPGLLPLVPAGVLAGAALAIANGLVDVERDVRTDRPSVVVALGARRAWLLHVALLAAVCALAMFAAPAVPPDAAARGRALDPGDALRWLRGWGTAIGIVSVAVGAVALRLARPAYRERGWELEAVGVAAIGLGWLAGVAGVEVATG